VIATCVVDASAAGAVVFREPAAAVVGPVLFAVRALRVPQIFHLELANIARTKVLRGELDWEEAEACLAETANWPIRVVSVGWRRALAVARESGLTAYDASYLSLARSHRLKLLTLDDDLRSAAGDRALTLVSRPGR
jgi:predicted nucleic acid-binding protein